MRGRRQQFASKLRAGAQLDWGAVTVSGFCFMLTMVVTVSQAKRRNKCSTYVFGKDRLYAAKRVDDYCQTVSVRMYFIPSTFGGRVNQVFWETVNMIKQMPFHCSPNACKLPHFVIYYKSRPYMDKFLPMKGLNDMSYNDDRRELLKLKQGLIEKSETINEVPDEQKVNYEVKGFGKKLANFFYYYKVPVVLITFVVLIAVFLAFTLLGRKNADIRVLIFVADPDTNAAVFYKINDFETAFEQYTPDFDENGYTYAEIYYINMNSEMDFNAYLASQSRLLSELNLGTAHLYIADRSQFEAIIGEQDGSEAFVGLSDLYPDDPHVVDSYYYHVKDSFFADALMYTDMEVFPDDLYIAIRISGSGMEENHRRALEVLDNMVKDRKITAKE